MGCWGLEGLGGYETWAGRGVGVRGGVMAGGGGDDSRSS